MSKFDLLTQKSDELRKLVNDALEDWEIDMDVELINLRAKRVRQCPPGYKLVWGPVEHPDGSVTYEWLCKKVS